MTRENMEIIQRALGILEGVAFGAGERVRDAIACAVTMFDEVMEKEVAVSYEKEKG